MKSINNYIVTQPAENLKTFGETIMSSGQFGTG